MACADGRARSGPPRTAATAAIVATAALMLAAGTAGAVTYKWVDEKGRVQYTDHLPPEAVNRRSVELDKQGMTRAVIEPPVSEAQMEALEAEKEKQAAAEREALRKRQQENALLSSYTSENDIEIAKKRNLALIGSAILSAEARIRAQQRRLAALDKEKLFYVKQPMPEKMRREIASIEADIPKQQALISLKNDEALAVIRRYDAQKAAFVALKAQIASEAPKRRLPQMTVGDAKGK